MEQHQFLPLVLFALVSSITPGPNNIMLMTSGANVGFIKTIPHILGIIFGFCLLILITGLGLMQIFHTYPQTLEVLKIACIAYLFYLAWKIASSKPTASELSDYRPMGFFAAACFQWVNPKAWTMALTAISVYSASAGISDVLAPVVIFGLVVFPSASIWIVAGSQLQKLLTTGVRFRLFNGAMALLLLVSVLASF